jgi:hypothetical protein
LFLNDYQDFLFDSIASLNILFTMGMKPKNDPVDDEGWAYGDVWKQGSPDQPEKEDDLEYVEIFRSETGMGCSDTIMLDYVLYLGQQGIRAIFYSYPARINVYVLEVEAGKEEEAKALLREKLKI